MVQDAALEGIMFVVLVRPKTGSTFSKKEGRNVYVGFTMRSV
jgi:hypothetical protein